MKRFYKAASTSPCEGGHGILLDGRPVRTPTRALLAVPVESLAAAIAAEWNDQGDDIDPGSMPMTGFANAAIDQIASNPAAFTPTISVYGESDLLCYRADGPEALRAHQAVSWQPLLDWASTHFGVTFVVTDGIVHLPQPEETLAKLRAAVAAYDPLILAPLSRLVGMSGSLVIGLAAVEQAFPVATLWQAAELDEIWQAEQWGDDDEALARRARRYSEFETAARFALLAAG